MVKQIFLDQNILQINDQDLPCLIHGAPHVGSSLFTVTLATNLFHQGYKLLFLSGYSMAMDEFITQTQQPAAVHVLENGAEIEPLVSKRVIFAKKADVPLFIKAVKSLPDIDERIIFVKNLELFDREVFEIIQDKQLVVLSGDIDACSYIDELFNINFATRIIFSLPKRDMGLTIPMLGKYQGYLEGNNKQGIVHLGIKLYGCGKYCVSRKAAFY